MHYQIRMVQRSAVSETMAANGGLLRTLAKFSLADQLGAPVGRPSFMRGRAPQVGAILLGRDTSRRVGARSGRGCY